jgi:hypothetical protein
MLASLLLWSRPAHHSVPERACFDRRVRVPAPKALEYEEEPPDEAGNAVEIFNKK